jgi:hypothetical protein
MSQSRTMSLVEAVTNVLVGYVLAVGMQLALFPLFGLYPTLGQTLQIGGWFTLLSLLRSYALRRLFEGLRREAAR